MKRFFLLGIIVMVFSFYNQGKSQSIGFSYFFPTNGYFSTPIAPVHVSIPVKFGKFIQISPGISMNNIGGMSMSGLPDELDSQRPLIGPFQSFTGTLIPAIVIPTNSFELELQGGLFGFTGINQKLMHGNFEDMLSEAYNYTSISSNLDLQQKVFGWGYVIGAKINIRIRDNIWGYIAGKYYIGTQSMPVSGDITYTKGENLPVNLSVSYPDAVMNYHGFEITIGGSMRKK